jgi:peptide-methionine (S)-S-oxide reductase
MASAVQQATFGGGCFWGMEKFFRKEFPKLKSVAVGYMGGSKKNPSYNDVCDGDTGHAEVVHVEFDPAEVKYNDLLTLFFRMHNPTTLNRQGNDRGTQYRSVIFYHSKDQKEEAKKFMADLESSKKFKDPLVTTVEKAGTLYTAEDYHQRYLEKNPGGYCNHKFYW